MMVFRRLLILSHRYLGIALSLVVLLWFASGFVIIYTGGMPVLTESERLVRQPDIDFSQVLLSPEQARALAGSAQAPILQTVMGRPAYRFPDPGGRVVFADDGRLLDGGLLSSRTIVADFTGAADHLIQRVGRVEEVDQWTIGLRGELPLEKFRVQDASATEVYVSPKWGQVVLFTTANDRLLAWLGAIPHWLYFVDLRRNAALWTDVVVWLASLGSLLALLGLIMIFTQLRWNLRPFRLRDAVPYRGLTRWHYWLGLVFGLVTLTWLFSGLLSMEPYQWTRPGGLALPRDALRQQPLELAPFAAITTPRFRQALGQLDVGGGVKEVSFGHYPQRHYYRLTRADQASDWGFSYQRLDADRLQSSAELADADTLAALLRQRVTAHRLVAQDVLTSYDDYYYARASGRGPLPPLPVLRVKFDDPQRTWFYADLASGQLVSRNHRWSRLDRWLYKGLHSLDFSFWYERRPLWDLGVLVLLGGGLGLTALGAWLGLRRLLRDASGLIR